MEKIDTPFTPWDAKINEVAARPLLGAGPQIRGFLGPGAMGLEAPGDGPSPSQQPEVDGAAIKRSP